MQSCDESGLESLYVHEEAQGNRRGLQNNESQRRNPSFKPSCAYLSGKAGGESHHQKIGEISAIAITNFAFFVYVSSDYNILQIYVSPVSKPLGISEKRVDKRIRAEWKVDLVDPSTVSITSFSSIASCNQEIVKRRE